MTYVAYYDAMISTCGWSALFCTHWFCSLANHMDHFVMLLFFPSFEWPFIGGVMSDQLVKIRNVTKLESGYLCNLCLLFSCMWAVKCNPILIDNNNGVLKLHLVKTRHATWVNVSMQVTLLEISIRTFKYKTILLKPNNILSGLFIMNSISLLFQLGPLAMPRNS